MIKHLFLFFSLLFFNLIIAQEREAKLLLKDNKSVEGFGEIKKNKIYFRLTLDEKPEVWTEDDAKGLEFTGYHIPEKYVYVFHGKKNEVDLMEVLQESSVQLYKETYYLSQNIAMPQSMQPGQGYQPSVSYESKIIEYYIKKPNDNKGVKVTMNFKKIGQTFFSDCEDLMAKINEEEFFEEEEIIDLVKFYNRDCKK